MTLKLYRKFRADLLEWAKVYRANDCPIVGGSALRSTRRQMAMLRDAYFRGEAY